MKRSRASSVSPPIDVQRVAARPVSERFVVGDCSRKRERLAGSTRDDSSWTKRQPYTTEDHQRTRRFRPVSTRARVLDTRWFVPPCPRCSPCPPWWRFVVIARYTHPDMGRIWSDQRRYETWLLVETAAAEAMAAAGIIPADAARDIRERGDFDVARIEAIEQTTQHDVIAFTTAVAEKVGAVGPLDALRDDFVGRRRHGAGAADARGVPTSSWPSRGPLGCHPRTRDRAPADADDWTNAWRPRRADDLRIEARSLVCRD